MENNTAVIFIQPLKLKFTSSGHYCVNIIDNEDKNTQGDVHILVAAGDATLKEQRNEDLEIQCDEEILTISEKLNAAEKQKILIRHHR